MSLTFLALFWSRLLYPTDFAQIAEIILIFCNLTTLWPTSAWSQVQLDGYTYLLLMTPAAEPKTIFKIVPGFTAPFLSTDPSYGVLHLGESCSLFRGWEVDAMFGAQTV